MQNFAPIGRRSSEITRRKKKKEKPQQNITPSENYRFRADLLVVYQPCNIIVGKTQMRKSYFLSVIQIIS